MNLEDEHSAPEADDTSSSESVSPQKPATFFQERPPQVVEVAPRLLRRWSRRDLLLFGASAIAAVGAGGALLPQTTLKRLGIIHENKDGPRKKWLLNKSLRIDDDVAEALYSKIAWCHLHQVADYPAQEQLQRSHPRPQLSSRMAFDYRRGWLSA
jgi:hypothetical protein